MELEERLPRPARGRKKRGKTTCQDIRRQLFNCGICGSADTFAHVIKVCSVCQEGDSHLRPAGCTCEVDFVHPVPWFGHPMVQECASCGAVKGALCPNCHRPAWVKGTRIFCKDCGFNR